MRVLVLILLTGCHTYGSFREFDHEKCERAAGMREKIVEQKPKKYMRVSDVQKYSEEERKCKLEMYATHEHNKEVYKKSKCGFKCQMTQNGFWSAVGMVIGIAVAL